MSDCNGQIQSLDRAFSIIDILANATEPLPLRTITTRASLPKPTVYRILSSLEAWNYVEQDKDKNYRLGSKFLVLGNKVQEDFEIRRVAQPFLKELNEETMETVFLGVLEKGRSLYIDKLDSRHSVRLASRVGTRNHLHSTSLGKCLLLGLEEQEVRNILEKYGMPAKTERTIIDPCQLIQQLTQVQSQGFAIDDMENEEGVRCIAAPILNFRGKAIAAISISGPAQRITDEAIEGGLKEALLRTAQGISQSLGYKY